MMKMPLNIGLTGGVGSGKSTVASIFETLDIPAYVADDRAKEIMVNDLEVKHMLLDHFGTELYAGGTLNRKWLADRIFSNEDDRIFVNSVVHPAVEQDFQDWRAQQDVPYVLREAAILFETGGYRNSDANILVTAPKATRMERVMNRDNTTREKVLNRMKVQWPDDRKQELADFTITNDGEQPLIPQVLKIHEDILRRANSRD